MMRPMVILVGCLLTPMVFAATETDTGTDTGGNQWPNCEPSVEPMWFASPMNGAVVTSPVVVEVDATYQCYCDDGACFPWQITEAEVRIDEIPGSTLTGPLGSFEFELEPGTYTFEARTVDWEYINASADPITVTVIADDPEPSSSTDTSGESSTSGESGTSGESSTQGADSSGSGLSAEGGASEESGAGLSESPGGASCSCSTQGEAPAWAGLGLLGLLALRRRGR